MTTQTSPVTAPTTDGVSRRGLLLGAGAAAGLAGLSPADARAAVGDLVSRAGVFAFGVASGDPTATEVLLWTRITPVPQAVPGSGRGPARDVVWEVAADEGFTDVVRHGTTRTGPGRDHTVKVVVGGLSPYTEYWYRFRVRREVSPVGRTRTAPDEPGATHALRLAFVSCSNWTGGYFTAYRGIAQRDDLDLVLHLGDYVYEYGNTPREPGVPGSGDRYGPAELVGVRDHAPAVEMVSLEDYRVRHALYKTDPDAQAAHARHPWVVIFDDHEVTNDTYATGAENHEEQDDPGTPYTGPGQPEGVRPEGDFLARRADAYQAYLEWMPIREPGWQPEPHRGQQFFRRFSFGDLADLSVVETRQNRAQQVPALVDGALNPALTDPERHLPEPEQLTWLADGLTTSSKPWHLVGNQTVLTRVLSTSGPDGTVFNTDQWDGYQSDQAAVLAAMDAAPVTDAVVLTGDIHSSWANELPLGVTGPTTTWRSAGVEFVCPSVTSNGFTEVLGSARTAQQVTASFQQRNPWVRYLDGIGHGFVVLDVTPERVQADVHFVVSGGDKGLDVDPRLDPDATTAYETSYVTVRGSRQVSGPVAELGPRGDEPRRA